jgi:hypothetical protein
VATRGERRRVRWWCCVLLVVCAVAVPDAREYRTVEVESLRVTIDSDWVPKAAPGYLPVRFDITNLGDARTIELVAVGLRSVRSSGTGQTSLRQLVRLEPGARVRLTIPVPVFGNSENIRFEIREGNRMLERFNYTSLQSNVPPGDASALIVSADPASAFGAIASGLLRTMTRSSSATLVRTVPGGTTVTMTPSPSPRALGLDVMLEPARLPATWLGFTSLRAVAIGQSEWEQLSDGQKGALLNWTACGGDLIFVDGALEGLVPGVRGETAAGEITGGPRQRAAADRVVGRYFLGRIHVLTSEVLASAGLSGLLAAAAADRDPLWAMPANSAPDWGVIEARGFRLSIPGVSGVPARTYLAMLVLFSLIIGPGSYWFLRRKGRLVLLVLTAPVISAAFIVLLAGYAMAGEGFHVQGRAMTFTVLDQVRKQAVTRASVSLYAPGLAPSAGLRFPRDVAVFPIGSDGGGTRERLVLDLTEAQSFTEGVLQARAPTNFEQAVVRPARERLTFSRSAGAPSVTNGLEAAVVALRYREGDRFYELDGPLPSGGQQAMKAAGAATAWPAGLSMPAKFLPLVAHQPAGSYLALLDRSPFWEPGTSGVIERGSVHVVLGWPEGQR